MAISNDIKNQSINSGKESSKRVYFISDIHLGAAYEPSTRDKEKRVVDFLKSITDDATHLYLMGDILDYWFEYRTVVPRGYVRFFGQLATMADRGIKITWFIGNHDIWLFDYLRDEIGIEVIDGSRVVEIFDKRFFLAHGDGVGQLPRSFRFIRSLFRNRGCQKLYSAIHPRWTIPFALRWSSHSRKKENSTPPFQGDHEPLLAFAREELKRDPSINWFVFGHRHLLVDIPLSPTCRFVILGDWLNSDSYAVFDGENFTLHSLNDAHIISHI